MAEHGVRTSARVPGTPLGGERSRRRFQSPLNEMDGMNTGSGPAGSVPELPGLGIDSTAVAIPLTPGASTTIAVQDQQAGPLTLESISALLDMKLSPVQQELAAIKGHAISRMEFNQAVKPLKEEVTDLTRRMSELEMSTSQPASRAASEVGSTIEAKLQELERQVNEINELQSARPRDIPHDREITALFGGLEKVGGEEAAKVWLKKKLSDLHCQTPTDVYPIGDFTGILFCKFDSKIARDSAVLKYTRARISHGGQIAWSRPDLPIERRVPETFLFALKKQLVAWEYTKQEVRVDTDQLTLKIDGEVIVQASVKDKELELIWEPTWLAWDDLINSQELAALKAKASNALTRAGQSGKGKGKKGSAGR